MAGTFSSSSSSLSSSSFDDVSEKLSGGIPSSRCVKFMCSYGGKILPRYSVGKLRYVGGDIRVLSVDRSLPFSVVETKIKAMCGWEAVSVRCQIPTEDLDALVSITSDEDLANLVVEYDLANRDKNQPLKIRAFLFPKSRSPPTTPQVTAAARIKGNFPIRQQVHASRAQPSSNLRCVHQMPYSSMVNHGRKPIFDRHLQQPCHYHHQIHHQHHEPRSHQYLLHHSNQWQY